MVEYHHRLNAPMVIALRRLYNAGRAVNLATLGLTRNQWDNFQKLRYFGLVRQVEVGGQRKRGVWDITENGREFVTGTLILRNAVWTYRGETVRFDGDLVHVSQVVDGYELRPEWAEEAQPLRHAVGCTPDRIHPADIRDGLCSCWCHRIGPTEWES
jgi:hypothetical protein